MKRQAKVIAKGGSEQSTGIPAGARALPPSEDIAQPEAKRFSAKQLSLTYPQCPLSKQEAARQFHDVLDAKEIKEMVIAQEHHTKEGLHLHVYIKVGTKYTCQGEHVKLHLKCPDTGKVYKPNVQPTKNKLAWVKYLHKEDKDTYTEGIQAAQYIQASESKTRILGKRLIDGENLEQLVREPGFEHFVPVYKNIKVSLEAYRLDSEQGYEAKGMRGIWFYGPPGSGKSHAAREKSIKMFGE